MTISLNHPLTIGSVRVQLSEGANADISHWRWRTQDALNRVTVADFGLPPQAILIVRQLPDPRPEQLLAEDSWHGANQWGYELQGWLSDHWRQAIRPVSEAVPIHARMVWFADRAEWLACLSWDVFSGIVNQHWWWQTWLQSTFYGDVGAMLYGLWQNELQALPQTLSILTTQHSMAVSALLSQLTSQQISALLQEIASQYDLPQDMSPSRLVDELTPLLPSTTQHLVHMLPTESAALVVLNLAIVQLPTIVHAIRHHIASEPPDHHKQPVTGTLSVFIPEIYDTDDELIVDTYTIDEHMDDVPDDSSTALPPTNLSEMTSANGHESVTSSDESNHKNTTDSEIISEADTISNPSHETSPDSHTLPTDISQSTDARTNSDMFMPEIDIERLMFTAENGIHTELGGVWYLVNLLVDLHWLYHPDYDGVNPYHKLYLLAIELLGDDIPDDPLWLILDELAQEKLPPKTGELWLREVLPVVDEFLKTHIEQPEIFIHALRDPAMLYVTRTHIDVVFELNQIRLELRLAGLDRNPTWVAELARIITIHYE